MRYLLIVLVAMCFIMIVYIIAMKLQIRKVRYELRRNCELSYDRQLTVTLIDNSINSLVTEINYLLDYQRKLKLEAVRSENNLKKSVADISHDLRTPMTVIKGNLQLIAHEEQLSLRGSEHLAICCEKADKLKEMADTFFELSLLESSDSAAEIQQINLTKVLMQFIADNEATIRLHGLEPQIEFPENTVFIRADEQMLLRILGNVLNNIIKYAKETFLVKIDHSDDKCTILFSNPVREGEMPNTEMMFERAYRADASRNGGSAGLGLFIVRLLAEKQNAKVFAETENDILTLKIQFPTKKNLGIVI